MSNEITRENVQAALDRNAAKLKDAALEAQEQQLRRTINHNHTTRTMTDIQRREARQAELRAQWQEREKARKAARFRNMKADAAVRYYGLVCLGTLLLAALTSFPLWAVLALSAGLGTVLAAYIYRLYVPLEVDKK